MYKYIYIYAYYGWISYGASRRDVNGKMRMVPRESSQMASSVSYFQPNIMNITTMNDD